MANANTDVITTTNVGNYILELAEKSDDIFWVREVNRDHFIYLGDAVEKMVGIKREKLYNNSKLWTDCIAEADREAYLQFFKNVKKGAKNRHQPYSIDYRIEYPRGSIIYIHEVVLPLFGEDAQLVGLAGLAKNITAEKAKLSELENSAHYFQLFAERVKAAFWVMECATNKQLYVSPGYEAIWGRSRESMYRDPTSFFDTVHPEDKASIMEVMQLRAKDEKDGVLISYRENRYRIFTPDNSIRHIKDTSFPIRDEKNNIILSVGMAEDVTKEVEYENALREAKEKAELANKAKSDFLAMISHELRTPLNAIMGMSQILKTKMTNDGVCSDLDVIIDAGNSLLSLVSDVLDFARLEVGKLQFAHESICLSELFQRTLKAVSHLADKKQLKLNLHVMPDLEDNVMGDPNRVRQVLTNLLTNAIKFTEQGGVSVYLTGSLQAKGQMCFDVIVEDTGIGIPQDKLNIIFDKFSQVDSIYQRKHGGIGLGLAITKELVEAMGGTVAVKSEVGVGSRFYFTLSLPLQTEKEKEDTAWREAVLQSDKRPQFNKRVLLVEDNLINQRIARMMLEDFGCQIDILNDGQEVMAQLETLQDYDLIFLDVGLPDMSGYEISARLRQEPLLRSKPIVAMTAHVLESDRAHAAAAGMDAVLGKPISYDEIRKVLARYL